MLQLSTTTPVAGAVATQDTPTDDATNSAADARAERGAPQAELASTDPLTRFSAMQVVHRDLEQFARAGSHADAHPHGQGVPLYAGQSSLAGTNGLAHAQSPTPQATRKVPEERLRAITDVLAKGGMIGNLRDRLLMDPKTLIESLKNQGIGFELRSGVATHYDSATQTMILGADESPAEQARALVFETRKLDIDRHKNQIAADLGNRAYQRESDRRPGSTIDPDIRNRYYPKTRADYVKEKMDGVIQAAGDSIEFARDLRSKGVSVASAPLEFEYDVAYNREYSKQYARVIAETGSHNVADNEAREKASTAGRAAVAPAINEGKLLTPDTREPYKAVFDRQWDAKEAQAAKQAIEADKARAAAKVDDERKAQVETARKAIVELVKNVDPKSADAQTAIKLLHAYVAAYGGEVLTLGDARPAIEKLLGPYGFRSIDAVGSSRNEVARLHYALENFARLTPQQRNEVLDNPRKAEQYGIKPMITYEEMQARDAQQLNFMRPDGTNFRGTRAELREAERRAVIQHALDQLNQIRSAGPASLVGRIVGGEKGAAIGAMFDNALPIVAGAKARANARNGIASNPVDQRTPLQPEARRAPAPGKPPASEVQPGPIQPAKPKAPLGETKVDNNTGASDPGRVARRADQQQNAEVAARRAERSAKREAEVARRVAQINANFPEVERTMPRPGETISADRALQGMQQQHWPTTASMNTARHAEVWKEMGNSGPPPVAFREGNVIRIDLQRLTPDQQRQFKEQATRVPPKAVGDRTVDGRAPTAPGLSPSQLNGRTEPHLSPSQLDGNTQSMPPAK